MEGPEAQPGTSPPYVHFWKVYLPAWTWAGIPTKAEPLALVSLSKHAAGINSRALQALLQLNTAEEESRRCTLSVSSLEIYNDT